jgi:hypothetical protein
MYATNPLSRDTDNDSFPDWQETQLGTDATVNDRDAVRDDDGDGLVNAQEVLGWDVRWISNAMILDDGDPGFGVGRGALTEVKTDGFDGDYRFTAGPREQDVAFWDFDFRFGRLAAGIYRVSTTWPEVTGAASDARFEVNIDGLDQPFVDIDQSVLPNDFTAQGAVWETLGVYTVVEGNRFEVFAHSTGGGKVIADAIRIERVSSLIMDDGDPGFRVGRGFLTAGTNGVGFKGDYRIAPPPLEANVAAWNFTNSTKLPAGQYLVSATWPVVAGAANNAVFDVNIDGVDQPLVTVDQSVAPNDFTDQGAVWENLGVYTVVEGNGFEVFAHSTGNGQVIADAIRIAWIGAANSLGAPLVDHVTPSRRDPDSDDDGLNDWEEFTGCRDRDGDLECDDEELRTNPEKRWGPTNPNSADTDGDGLTDREEVDSVDFPGDDKTPFRFTDPLDWDSDDDGRSDGDEVKVPWEVKVAGQPTREVYSDPLKADADGDALKDGNEFALGSDPSNPDTDGDGAFDGVEYARALKCEQDELCISATNVLVPDRWVTVDFLRMTVGGVTPGDGDGDGEGGIIDRDKGAGEFRFEFGIEYPVIDETGAWTLTRLPLTSHSDVTSIGECGLNLYLHGCAGWQLYSGTDLDDPASVPGIYSLEFMQLSASHSINLLQNQSGKNMSRRTFAVPMGAVFTVYGNVTEWDFQHHGLTTTIFIGSAYELGGIGSPDGSFVDIKRGVQPIAFESTGGAQGAAEIQVQVIVRAE